MDVSVIILTYNQENTVARTIESVLNQKTNYEIEVIIGEDNSSDNTRCICEEYVRKYPDMITLVPQHPNYGVVRNFYECTRMCHGSYLMVCAGDDWWHNENKIQLQVDFLQSNDDYVLCYGNFKEYYPATETYIEKNAIKCQYPLFDFVLRCNPICAPTVCIRKTCFDALCFEDYIKECFLVEDYPMWLGLSLQGNFGIINDSLVTYTIQMGSIHNCKSYNKRLSYLENFRKMRLFFVNKTDTKTRHLEVIEDLYHSQLAEAAVQYGHRKDAFRNYKKIVNKDIKDMIKLAICTNSFSFNIFNKRYNKNM